MQRVRRSEEGGAGGTRDSPAGEGRASRQAGKAPQPSLSAAGSRGGQDGGEPAVGPRVRVVGLRAAPGPGPMDIRWQEDRVRRDCAVHARERAASQEQGWTVWRGGFASTHRHVIDSRGRWLKDGSKLGRAPEDRQRRLVGQGPLWTGQEGALGAEARRRPQPLVFFNAFPKRWGEGEGLDAASECICHTIIPRGTLEEFRGGSRSRSRARTAAAAAAAAAGGHGVPTCGAARGGGVGGGHSEKIAHLRQSHLDTLEAAQRIGERGDVALQQRALAAHLREIESALAALAALRAKARVEGSGFGRDARDPDATC